VGFLERTGGVVGDPTASPRPGRRPRHGLARRFLVLASTALTALTVLSLAGDAWWVLDLFANARLQLAATLLVLAAVLVWYRPWWAAGVALLGAGVNIALIAPFLLPAGPAPAVPGGETLDITFLNVKVDGADRDEVIEYLRGHDHDVVVLAATGQDWEPALRDADLHMTPLVGSQVHPLLELTILARDAEAEIGVYGLADDARSAYVEVVVKLDDQRIRILGTHPVSPLTPSRAARRDAHLARIAARIAESAEPVVLVGDLNVTPWSATYRSLLTTADLVDSQRAHGLQPSWPAPINAVGLPIDHVLHTQELTTRSRELGPSFGSDHRSVHARIARAAEPG
jgi:endonuclease/exonuclease/phosphatase (EEP) superfamily protein YafD